MAESSSPTGRTLRPRNTSAVFGFWNALTWTRRWHGRAKASSPLGGRARCERSSLCRPPQRTERYGGSELVLRSGVFETRLATDSKQTTKYKRAVATGHCHAEGQPSVKRLILRRENYARKQVWHNRDQELRTACCARYGVPGKVAGCHDAVSEDGTY